MKITTENFSEALALAGRAAATNTPMDILKFARFTAKDGWFTLACHNLSIYAEAKGECGAGDLEFCVRADRLASALATAGETIDLTLKGAMLTWKSGRSRYQMSTMPVADFPTPKRDTKPLLTLEDPTIAESLGRVVFGCATRDIRAWSHGVLIECVKGKDVVLVATDGAKLASLTTETKAPADANVVIHRDCVNALADGAERVRIFRESVEFDYPNGLLIACTIDAQFPEWRRALSIGKQAARITLDRKALVHAIKAALPFDQLGQVRFVMNDGALRIESADQGGDSAEVKLEAKGEGDADAWFASGVISPAIQAARGDEMVMLFGAHGQSASIECGPLRCVCAPMRR